MAAGSGPLSKIPQEILAKVEQFGQQHLVVPEELAKLSEEELSNYIKDLEQIDFQLVQTLYENVYKKEALPTGNLEPFPEIIDRDYTGENQDQKEWWTSGLKLVSEGKVAVIIMSGGMGSRLGSDDPKGMYDIEMPSHKSIFQIQCEKILAVQRIAAQEFTESKAITLVLMTSSFTHDKVVQFMEYNDYFGLDANDVLYFQQGALPAIDFDGKILRESKSKIGLCPNGNGDIYRALKDTGMLNTLSSRQIEYVHLMGVDNMLCHVADPLFLGFTAEKNLEIAHKVIQKRPDENVGVILHENGKPAVIEYTELPEELSGQPACGAGNILNHIYTLSSLTTICNDGSLNDRYHKAIKAIKAYNPQTGKSEKPATPNGVKFEMFYFDAFYLVPNAGVLKVDAEDEFAPIKNAPGVERDSPEMARKLMTKRFAKWLRAAGCLVEGNVETDLLEISSLVSINGERLEFYNEQRLKLPAYIFI